MSVATYFHKSEELVVHSIVAVLAPQVQDAVMASKRRDAPHLVAPIRRYATSKVGGCCSSDARVRAPAATTTTRDSLHFNCSFLVD